jgi:hypothetical protein
VRSQCLIGRQLQNWPWPVLYAADSSASLIGVIVHRVVLA